MRIKLSINALHIALQYKDIARAFNMQRKATFCILFEKSE